MCRSRRELSNAYLLAKIGVDTAENEPLEVWGENSIHYSLHSLDTTRPPDAAAGCCHCLHDFDSVGAVATRSPGAATAYMSVEKQEKKEEAKGLSYGAKLRG